MGISLGLTEEADDAKKKQCNNDSDTRSMLETDSDDLKMTDTHTNIIYHHLSMRLNSALSTRPLLISTRFRAVNDMSIK